MGKSVRVKKGTEVLEIDSQDLPFAVNDGYLPTERLIVSNPKTKESFEIDPNDYQNALKDGFSFQDVAVEKKKTQPSFGAFGNLLQRALQVGVEAKQAAPAPEPVSKEKESPYGALGQFVLQAAKTGKKIQEKVKKDAFGVTPFSKLEEAYQQNKAATSKLMQVDTYTAYNELPQSEIDKYNATIEPEINKTGEQIHQQRQLIKPIIASVSADIEKDWSNWTIDGVPDYERIYNAAGALSKQYGGGDFVKEDIANSMIAAAKRGNATSLVNDRFKQKTGFTVNEYVERTKQKGVTDADVNFINKTYEESALEVGKESQEAAEALSEAMPLINKVGGAFISALQGGIASQGSGLAALGLNSNFTDYLRGFKTKAELTQMPTKEWNKHNLLTDPLGTVLPFVAQQTGFSLPGLVGSLGVGLATGSGPAGAMVAILSEKAANVGETYEQLIASGVPQEEAKRRSAELMKPMITDAMNFVEMGVLLRGIKGKGSIIANTALGGVSEVPPEIEQQYWQAKAINPDITPEQFAKENNLPLLAVQTFVSSSAMSGGISVAGKTISALSKVPGAVIQKLQNTIKTSGPDVAKETVRAQFEDGTISKEEAAKIESQVDQIKETEERLEEFNLTPEQSRATTVLSLMISELEQQQKTEKNPAVLAKINSDLKQHQADLDAIISGEKGVLWVKTENGDEYFVTENKAKEFVEEASEEIENGDISVEPVGNIEVKIPEVKKEARRVPKVKMELEPPAQIQPDTEISEAPIELIEGRETGEAKPFTVELSTETPTYEKELYHGTNADFVEFRPQGLGVHFGTENQAKEKGGKIIKAKVNIRNPFRMDDMGSDYDIARLADELLDAKLISKEEKNELQSNGTSEDIKEILKANGYDGIVYKNRNEDKSNPTDSYIAFDKSQITLPTTPTVTTKEEPTVKEEKPKPVKEPSKRRIPKLEGVEKVQPEVKTEEVPEPLKDVESTAKALDGTDLSKMPNVSWHGSKNRNLIFGKPKEGKVSKSNMQLDFGTHFTSEDYASFYEGDKGKKYPAIIDLKSPLDLTQGMWWKDDPNFERVHQLIKDLKLEKSYGSIDFFDKNGIKQSSVQGVSINAHKLSDLPPKRVSDALKKNGFDGIIYEPYHPQGGKYYEAKPKSFIVLDNSSIKEPTPKNISEAYHKAKADGTNPELVKAVEDLISGQKKETATLPEAEAKQTEQDQQKLNKEYKPKKFVSNEGKPTPTATKPIQPTTTEPAASDIESKKIKNEQRSKLTNRSQLPNIGIGNNQGKLGGRTFEDEGGGLQKRGDDTELRAKDTGLQKSYDLRGKIADTTNEINSKSIQEIDNLISKQRYGLAGSSDYEKLRQKIYLEERGLTNEQLFNESKRPDFLKTQEGRIKFQSEFSNWSNAKENKAKVLSELYHQSKSDGTNPELVKAVEDVLKKPTPAATKPTQIKGYHYTDNDFTEFEQPTETQSLGKGVYFYLSKRASSKVKEIIANLKIGKLFDWQNISKSDKEELISLLEKDLPEREKNKGLLVEEVFENKDKALEFANKKRDEGLQVETGIKEEKYSVKYKEKGISGASNEQLRMLAAQYAPNVIRNMGFDAAKLGDEIVIFNAKNAEIVKDATESVASTQPTNQPTQPITAEPATKTKTGVTEEVQPSTTTDSGQRPTGATSILGRDVDLKGDEKKEWMKSEPDVDKYISTELKRFKKERDNALKNAKKEREQGNEEKAQIFEGIAEDYNVNEGEFIDSVKKYPRYYINSNVDPALRFKNKDINLKNVKPNQPNPEKEYALKAGYYQQAIRTGRMTATDAKTIIEGAGLEVPQDIIDLAAKEGKGSVVKSEVQPSTTRVGEGRTEGIAAVPRYEGVNFTDNNDGTGEVDGFPVKYTERKDSGKRIYSADIQDPTKVDREAFKKVIAAVKEMNRQEADIASKQQEPKRTLRYNDYDKNNRLSVTVRQERYVEELESKMSAGVKYDAETMLDYEQQKKRLAEREKTVQEDLKPKDGDTVTIVSKTDKKGIEYFYRDGSWRFLDSRGKEQKEVESKQEEIGELWRKANPFYDATSKRWTMDDVKRIKAQGVAPMFGTKSNVKLAQAGEKTESGAAYSAQYIADAIEKKTKSIEYYGSREDIDLMMALSSHPYFKEVRVMIKRYISSGAEGETRINKGEITLENGFEIATFNHEMMHILTSGILATPDSKLDANELKFKKKIFEITNKIDPKSEYYEQVFMGYEKRDYPFELIAEAFANRYLTKDLKKWYITDTVMVKVSEKVKIPKSILQKVIDAIKELFGAQIEKYYTKESYKSVTKKVSAFEALTNAFMELDAINITPERYRQINTQGNRLYFDKTKEGEKVTEGWRKAQGENKTLADTIRKAKIKTDKAFDATLGLPVAVWNGAVEVVAKAVEGGVAAVEAVKRGINYIQKNHRGKWNKQAYNDRIVAELGLRGITINGEDLYVKDTKEFAETINGFYSDIEQALLDSKKQSQPAKDWISELGNSDEAKWTGLRTWLEGQTGSVSKADIRQYLKDNRIEIVEVVKSSQEELPAFERDLREDTKFSQYQLEGEKENYKEILVTLPNKNIKAVSNYNVIVNEEKAFLDKISGMPTEKQRAEFDDIKKRKEEAKKLLPKDSFIGNHGFADTNEKTFKSSHFDEPNILVHIRTNTRVDADGNNILFLEEVQSDYAQAGRKQGFWPVNTYAMLSGVDKKHIKYKDWLSAKSIKRTDDEIVNDISNGGEYFEEYQKEKSESESTTNIFPAPFVTETASWTKLGLKVALKEAVSQGVSKIAWSTGTQQFERWGSEKIDWNTILRPNGGSIVVKDESKAPIIRGRRTKNLASISSGLDTQKEIKRIAEKWGLQPSDLEYEAGNGRWVVSIQEQVEGTAFEGVDIDEDAMSDDGIVVNSKADLRNAIAKNLSRERNDAEIDKLTERIWNRMQTEQSGTSLPRKEGMEAFYGVPSENKLGIVGNVAKALFKQTPKTVEIEVGKKYRGYIEVLDNDGNVVNTYGGAASTTRNAEIEAENIGGTIRRIAPKITSTQYSIDITPELKAEVQGGIPLFGDIKGRGKEIADWIRTLRPPSDFAQSNILGLPIAIYDTAIVAIANAVEGGATIAQAIADAIADIKKQFPKWAEEKEFEETITKTAGFETWVSNVLKQFPDATLEEIMEAIEEDVPSAVNTDYKRKQIETRVQSVIDRTKKGGQNAVQEPSAKKTDVGQVPEDGEGVGEGDTEGEETAGESRGEGDEKDLDDIGYEVKKIPVIRQYLSGETIEKRHYEEPENNQDYEALELQQAAEQGRDIISTAKKVYGDNWVNGLLSYAKKTRVDNEMRALIYVSLENELFLQKGLNPEKAADIQKLQNIVRAESQAFARTLSNGLNLYRLRDAVKYRFLEKKVLEEILTDDQKAKRKELEEVISVKPAQVVNQEAENLTTEKDLKKESDIAKAAEEDKAAKKKKQKPVRKKSNKKAWVSIAAQKSGLNDMIDRVKSQIENLDC